MAGLHSKRRGRRGVLLGTSILGLGSVAGILAASASSGSTGALSLVLQPNHADAVSGMPKGPAAVGWESSNWSGYAETSSAPYTSVSGQWTVPTVTGPSGSYSAAWIGIDGFNNDSLIQTGTEQDYSGGSGQYSAWWTTSSKNFEEQTITTGCSTSAAPQSGAASDVATTRSVIKIAAPHDPPARNSASPSASTGSASNITSSGATLNGTVNPNGAATDYYFEYGTSAAYGSETTPVSAGSGKRAIAASADLTDLSASTTYYFQLVAYNSRVTVDGGGSSFLTTSGNGGSSGGSSCGTVKPGDTMTATIAETNTSTSTWTISLTDTTQGWTFSNSVTYTGPRSSAEWIVEAPSLCSGSRCTIATLADYGSTIFEPDSVNVGSDNAGLVSSEGGEIVNSSGQVVSVPSNPNTEGDGFAIAYGSTAPSPPSS
jgi:Peptidase A4 family